MRLHAIYSPWPWLVAALAAVAVCSARPAAAQEPSLMTIETLNAALTDPDVVILDVRTGRDWDASGSMIQGARRVDPHGADQWGSTLDRAKTIVLYCA